MNTGHIYKGVDLDLFTAYSTAFTNHKSSHVFLFSVLSVDVIDCYHGNMAQGQGGVTFRVNYSISLYFCETVQCQTKCRPV